MQESRLADATIGAAPAKSRVKQIGNLLYALYFLPVFLVIRFLTAILVLVKFSRMLPFMHRVFGLRNRVLYLETFFPQNAGYHYRTQKWVDILNDNGFEACVRYVLSEKTFVRFVKEARVILFQSTYLFRRIWHSLVALSFNCVIVRRELLQFNDYGDLFLDKFLLAMHPNVILDFDDDISAAKREPREITPFGRLMFENPAKFSGSLSLYQRFIVGTSYLRDLLRNKRPRLSDESVITIPTGVDYDQYPAKVYDPESEYINFGWIGSAANHYVLDIVTPVLCQVSKRHKVRFVLITSDYDLDADFEVIHVPWSLETEIESLYRIDIGLMPLYDNAEERGKCGFKLIQYMGLGIVSIASAVTVNSEIVDDGENGFLVYRESDWLRVIEDVLSRRSEFPRIGAAARKKIQSKFSFEANQQQYLDFIRSSIA
ncbi:MAG: glycosyltransferase family 4 protein [Blastocatellia bacterium]